MKDSLKAILFSVGFILVLVYGVKYLLGEDGRVEVDPTLKPLVEEWIETMEEGGIGDARERLNHVHEIKLCGVESITGPETLGNTTIDGDIVKINDRIVSRDLMLNTLFHELGHALFDLDHGGSGIMMTEQSAYGPYPVNDPAKLKEYINLCLANQ
jgi:hypothetical protein